MRDARWKDRILFLLRRVRAVQVSGDSMRPTLNDGDVVLVKRHSALEVGEVVVADHPFKSSVTVLKRVSAIDNAGRLHLIGDNPDESTDSRSFGSVPKGSIRGKVVCRLKRR